jgi:hypothetical protein
LRRRPKWMKNDENERCVIFFQKNIEKCRKGGIMMEKLQIIGKEPEMDKKIKKINYFDFVLWEMMQKGQVIRERAKIDKNQENKQFLNFLRKIRKMCRKR